MSDTRKVECNYDLKVLAEAARELGYIVEYNSDCRMWYNSERMDMTIKCKPGAMKALDWGFITTDKGVMECRADFHGEENGVVSKMAQEILPVYARRKIGRKGKIDRVVKENGKLRVYIRKS